MISSTFSVANELHRRIGNYDRFLLDGGAAGGGTVHDSGKISSSGGGGGGGGGSSLEMMEAGATSTLSNAADPSTFATFSASYPDSFTASLAQTFSLLLHLSHTHVHARNPAPLLSSLPTLPPHPSLLLSRLHVWMDVGARLCRSIDCRNSLRVLAGVHRADAGVGIYVT